MWPRIILKMLTKNRVLKEEQIPEEQNTYASGGTTHNNP